MIKQKNKNVTTQGGIVLGYEKIKKTEQLNILNDDVHSIILGATRSGKTRNILIQSICAIALSGESQITSDVKGELFDYTSCFLERIGYEVIPIDFRTPMKSKHYNFLQPIIDAFQEEDIPKAVNAVWDITNALVSEVKHGERIWHDGEYSVIAGSIMAVVYDNLENPEFQNLTNAYYFLSNMCMAEPDGKIPLNEYIAKLEDTHPAKGLFAVALVAPNKTRGSFFTSALATLKIFTNPYIYNMTKDTEFDIKETGTKKRAIFIILPDEKTTYHWLASLFVQNQYLALVESADERGGRLKHRVNFLLEEFGNFTKIGGASGNFSNYLTVGAGRGCRFNLVIQSFSQIEEKYGKEQAETIKDNCHCLIYLHCENPNTNKEVSGRLGKYTTSSYSRSMSVSRNQGSTNSVNLIARDLLTPDEISKIQRPYLLVIYSGCNPAIMQMPDLSQWYFNTMLGMGDKEHNTYLRKIRGERREKRQVEDFKLWGIWKYYKKLLDENSLQDFTDFPEDNETTDNIFGFDDDELKALQEIANNTRLSDIDKYE